MTAGFGSVSHWYRNIQANPHIEVWLPDGWWQAEAKDITAQEQHTAIRREVLKNNGCAAFAAGINPYTVSDEALEKATADYRLLHIRRTAPCAGPGGPGDLVWVWPVLLVVALFARFRWVVRK
ncbi:MAG: nitroreductase family deazaflavin-dependent oxidoreductase [Chloroflexi bacterium]|nr:nitroreductase family deazaflavin-dependent oxidoreductase [Chloroflexota bacterium]